MYSSVYTTAIDTHIISTALCGRPGPGRLCQRLFRWLERKINNKVGFIAPIPPCPTPTPLSRIWSYAAATITAAILHIIPIQYTQTPHIIKKPRYRRRRRSSLGKSGSLIQYTIYVPQ